MPSWLCSKRPPRAYLEASGNHVGQEKGGIYAVVGASAQVAGIAVAGLEGHGLRATAATSAIEYEADIARVQRWLGRANISTALLYDRHRARAAGSPMFRAHD